MLRPIAPVGTFKECVGSAVQLPPIMLPIPGHILTPKLIFGVTIYNLGIMVTCK
ncbi:hypothetical protein E2C01_090478 [Portunus trituberculatus]|uniref:Uncharacterized protein n=1 Tax=Portunus trituberculatus TaxID=210409 RepID=A0A5B7JLW4_PORTR|nr:hypothetical protein [Portunus trituberculatus]